MRELKVFDESESARARVSIEPSVWCTLTRHPLNGPLFPRLERLVNFRLSSPITGLTEFMLFRSPHLRHVDLDMTAYTTYKAEMADLFIQEIAGDISLLESLSIRRHHSEKIVHPIELWKSQSLHALKIEPDIHLNRRMLEFLMGFGHLRSLSIKLAEGTDVIVDEAMGEGFPQLKELCLSGKADLFHPFITVAHSQYLESLNVEMKYNSHTAVDERVNHLSGIYAILPSTVRRLHITWEGPGHGEYGVDVRTLYEGLLGRSELHQLSFEFINHYGTIADEDMRSIEATWPNLTAFSCTYNAHALWSIDRDSGAIATMHTLSTIASFVTNHPYLERLALPSIPASPLPPLAEIPGCARLKLLEIPYFVKDVHLFRLALALDHLFPNLELQENMVQIRSPHHGEELKLLLLGLQSGRRGVTCASHGI